MSIVQQQSPRHFGRLGSDNLEAIVAAYHRGAKFSISSISTSTLLEEEDSITDILVAIDEYTGNDDELLGGSFLGEGLADGKTLTAAQERPRYSLGDETTKVLKEESTGQGHTSTSSSIVLREKIAMKIEDPQQQQRQNDRSYHAHVLGATTLQKPPPLPFIKGKHCGEITAIEVLQKESSASASSAGVGRDNISSFENRGCHGSVYAEQIYSTSGCADQLTLEEDEDEDDDEKEEENEEDARTPVESTQFFRKQGSQKENEHNGKVCLL